MRFNILISTVIILIFASGCTNLAKVEDWRILPQDTNKINAPSAKPIHKIDKIVDNDNKISVFCDFPDSSKIEKSQPKRSLSQQKPYPYNTFSPPKFMAMGLLTFYRTVLTHGIKTSCPFCITCSAYSVRALREYGLILGYIMTIDRLIRCNRDAGNRYFLKLRYRKTDNKKQRSICLVDEPSNNNIFHRKERKK